MMIDLFGQYWEVILLVGGALVASLFPQLKPIIDFFKKNPPAPKPGPQPDLERDPTLDVNPERNDLLNVVSAAQLIIEHFEAQGNEAGEALARQVAQALFADVANTTTTTRAKAK